MIHPKQCEVEDCESPAQKYKRICGLHLGSHDPTPEHHVAADRTCLRCGIIFASAWAGERICTDCREREKDAKKQAAKRGRSHAYGDSPFEPLDTPSMLSETSR